MNFKTTLAAAALAAMFSGSAFAYDWAGNNLNTCSLTDVQGAVACKGSFPGNNVGNAEPGLAETLNYVNSTFGFSFTKANVVEDLSYTGSTLDLGGLFTGEFVVALKAGAGKQGKSGGFALYKIDGGTTGFSSLTFSTKALGGKDLSHATLIAMPMPAVPEPETYAMLLAGLGFIGALARRRKA